MKFKTIILSMTGVLILSAVAFAAKPPSKVAKAFNAKFSHAANVKWAKENAREWEAGFTVNGLRMSANFTNDGTWVETEKEIAVGELPEMVASSIKVTHADWNITHAYKIDSAAKGTFYEAEIISGKKKQEVMLNEDGTAIK